MEGRAEAEDQISTWYSSIYNAIQQTDLNLTLLVVSAFVFYKVVSLTRRQQRNHRDEQRILGPDPIKLRPKLKLQPLRSDFTVRELQEFDGTREDGRMLVAINFNVYDVSQSTHCYGPQGVYSNFAGRDISRDLINFTVRTSGFDEFDDLWDLSLSQMSILIEWDLQYKERYPYVGKLLREGVPHTDYAMEDEFEGDSEQEMEEMH
ncbi:hypothetical protein KR009_007410 [Drosophila setifemur]|nr:hypothetical protein KR009_007410 [Drosophila setifemur]